MTPIAAISASTAPGPSARLRGAQPRADMATDMADLLLKLEETAFHYKVALRVNEAGMASQPLSRVDTTDLALMIVTGGAVSHILDAASASFPSFAVPPGGYAEGY